MSTFEPCIDELLPDQREIRLLRTKDVDPLPARDLGVEPIYRTQSEPRQGIAVAVLHVHFLATWPMTTSFSGVI